MASHYVIALNGKDVAEDVWGPFSEERAYELVEEGKGMICVAKAQATFNTP